MVILVRNKETTCILLAAALRLALRANALHVHGRGGGLAACGAADGGISQTQKPPHSDPSSHTVAPHCEPALPKPALPNGSAGSQCDTRCGMPDRCGGFLRVWAPAPVVSVSPPPLQSSMLTSSRCSRACPQRRALLTPRVNAGSLYRGGAGRSGKELLPAPGFVPGLPHVILSRVETGPWFRTRIATCLPLTLSRRWAEGGREGITGQPQRGIQLVGLQKVLLRQHVPPEMPVLRAAQMQRLGRGALCLRVRAAAARWRCACAQRRQRSIVGIESRLVVDQLLEADGDALKRGITKGLNAFPSNFTRDDPPITRGYPPSLLIYKGGREGTPCAPRAPRSPRPARRGTASARRPSPGAPPRARPVRIVLGRISSPAFPPAVAPQAALKFSYHSDRVTRY